MTTAEFKASLTQTEPPGVSLPLRALWHDGRGDWNAAHETAQNDNGPAGSWVHAYLHRKEGDLGNASYWYRRAGKPVPKGAIDEEWSVIVAALLATPASA